MTEEGTLKKLAVAFLTGLAGLALIGTMALAVFGADRLLRAIGVIGP